MGQMCEKYLAKKKSAFWVFMVMKKSYYNVDRGEMRSKLRMYKERGSSLREVQSFYFGRRACHIWERVECLFRSESVTEAGLRMSP